MLDIKYVVGNKEDVIANLNRRSNDDWATKINEICNLYEDYKVKLAKNEQIKEKLNKISKQIGELRQKNEDISALVQEAEEIKQQLIDDVNPDYQTKLSFIPNLIQAEVPSGEDEDSNVVIKHWKTPSQFDFEIKSHDEIEQIQSAIDFKRAAKIAKARFVITSGFVAKLERALQNFMLDEASKRGYLEYRLPFIVKEKTLFGSGNLPKFRDDLFAIEKDQMDQESFFLIPTAEVPLANIYANEIVEEKLPLLLTAYTECFRSEAGSAGKDTKGLIRMHQFSKIELFKYVLPENSEEEHQKMVEDAENILEKLELPYRRILLCAGDMGFGSTKTYDLEVWIPSQNKYRECSSISNVMDFQARRNKTRFRVDDKIIYPHMLNGSGMATGRILAAVLENYQQADGSIIVPKVLEKYLN